MNLPGKVKGKHSPGGPEKDGADGASCLKSQRHEIRAIFL